MAGFSSYVKNAIAAWINGTAMPTAPATRYVALFNGDPDSGGTEVTTTVRAAGRPVAAFSRASNVLTSSADADFGNSAGAVASVSHFAIFDATSAGNQLMSGALTGGATAISAGTGVKFTSGNLVLTVN